MSNAILRLELRGAGSQRLSWDIDTGGGAQRVVVGTAPAADWQVHGPGVAPTHFQLSWDGQQLWLSAPQGGTLALDGRPVDQWVTVRPGQGIQFGQAQLVCALAPAPDAAAHTVIAGGEMAVAAAAATASAAAPDVALRPRLGAGTAAPATSTEAAATVFAMSAMTAEQLEALAAARDEGGRGTLIMDPLQEEPANAGPTPPAAAPPAAPAAQGFALPPQEAPAPPRRGRPLVIAAIAALVLGVGIAAAAITVATNRTSEAEADAAAALERGRLQAEAETARADAVLEERAQRERELTARVEAGAAVFDEEQGRALAESREGGLEEEAAVAARRAELEHRGAGLLATNRHADALALYEQMARVYPDDPTFAALVEILRGKVDETGRR